MYKIEGVDVLCEGDSYIVFSEHKLERDLIEMHKRKEVMLGKKVLPVELTNGMRTLEIFVAASNISGWEKNGGTRKEPYYVKGTHEIAKFFRVSLGS